MDIRNIRQNILAAREKRAFLRGQCAMSGKASLSLALNIPGYPKSTPLFSTFFDHILTACQRFLLAHRILIEQEQELLQRDEAGDFYLVPLCDGQSPASIKTLCETFETTHILGRLIDLDVTDQHGQPVSSHKLKRCLLCEKPAIVCMRAQTHVYQELREEITARITSYLEREQQKRICKQLVAFALKSALYEISVSPKPGLVDRFEQGAHQDMDYFTFLDSTAALAGYFEELALAGYTFERNQVFDKNLVSALPIIRTIGLKMETAMFLATGGVNTQKGFIFLSGLVVFATAYLLARDGVFETESCREVVATICQNLVQRELTFVATSEQTHGAHCFRQYGSEYGGVRQEAENGLPSVFDHGLLALKQQLADVGNVANAQVMNAALIHTLLKLMTVVNDTNIIYRKDVRTLKTVKQQAQHVLDAESPSEQQSRYAELIDYCARESVSPGGSADLLAVTLFLYFVESAFSEKI